MYLCFRLVWPVVPDEILTPCSFLKAQTIFASMPGFWNFEQAKGLKSLQVEVHKQVEVVGVGKDRQPQM